MDLGRMITTYRKEHGLSMREFAARAGLSHSYLSFLERGISGKSNEPMSPSIETMEKIARGMGISVLDLVDMLNDGEKEMPNLPPVEDLSKAKKALIESVKNLDDDSVRKLQQLVDMIK